MKKAIFLDIDGTLLDCLNGITEITDTVKTVIKGIQEKGDYVFIATGRPYAFLSKSILDFGFDGFVLANGAHVIVNGQTVYSDYIKKDNLQAMISIFDREGIQYILQSDKYSYMKKEFKEFYDFYESVGVSKRLIKDEYNLNDLNIFKVEMLCLNEESYNLCLNLIKENEEYNYVSSLDIKALEFYMKKDTKATGIYKALQFLNVDIKDSYAFGDGRNDIEMLQAVNCGIAMGNASDEVKGYANKVTDTVQNDGVASGILKYVI
ncbi:MAG: HAD family hydrolase [Clostridium sp.]